MTFWSMLTTKVPEDKADSSIAVFIKRRCIEESAEILRQATANNRELLVISGPRSPYPGKLGAIEEGALADILLINGNPLEDPTLFHEPEENLALIVKDGKIYENTVN